MEFSVTQIIYARHISIDYILLRVFSFLWNLSNNVRVDNVIESVEKKDIFSVKICRHILAIF